ncbi:MAG: NAD(P)/FAD-dependent oxidoreductase [bacterium]|nr:NAD(P)/FAD-dependent oxidoreductase [bacterium]
MSVRQYVIVGNGFAGTSAAQTLRAIDPECAVALIGNEPHTLYNRISLPPFLRRQLPLPKVFIRDRAWHDQHKIDLHLETLVTRVDPQERVVYTEAGAAFPYDALLIATGGRPNLIAAPGAGGARNIYNFQFLEEAIAIDKELESAKTGVVIGGSFIGYELAEAFVARGVETHWVIRADRFLNGQLDDEAARLVDHAAREVGVKVHYNETVVEMEREGDRVTAVSLKGGERIPCQIVGVGLGLAISTELLAGSGVDLNVGVLTDEYLRTNVPGIFAAGDAAEFFDPVSALHARVGTWNNAGAQGKTVAQSMAGNLTAFHDPAEYSSLLFAGQMIVQFGVSPRQQPAVETEREFDIEGRSYRCLHFHGDRLVGGVLLGKKNRAGLKKYLELMKAGGAVNGQDRRAMLAWRA